MAKQWEVEGKIFDKYYLAHEYAHDLSEAQRREIDIHVILEDGSHHLDSNGQRKGVKAISGSTRANVPLDVY